VLPDIAEIVHGRAITRLDFEGSFVGRPGFIEPLEFKQRDAMIAVRLRRSGLDHKGLLQRSFSRLPGPGVELGDAEQAEGVKMIRMEGQNLAADELRLGEPPGLVGCQRGIQQFADGVFLLLSQVHASEGPCSLFRHGEAPVIGSNMTLRFTTVARSTQIGVATIPG